MPTLTSLSGARHSRTLKGARQPGRISLLSWLSALAVLGWFLTGGLPAQATAPAPTSVLPVQDQPGSLISHTANHSSSISSAGPTTTYRLYEWGDNAFGQLGNGGVYSNSTTPVVVNLPPGVTPIAIAAGFRHSLAIGSDNKLYAWGNNLAGQLGNGTTSGSEPNSHPVVVNLPPGVSPTAIAAGGDHSLAIGSDGKLYAWGDNFYGQLGNGTTSLDNPTPVVVSLPPGVSPSKIAAGNFHSLAIGSDGKLYAWGYNHDGQLGNGTTSGYGTNPTPVVVNLSPGVSPTAVAAGYDHSLGIGSDGKLYAWGYNSSGQLGNGTTSGGNPNPTPVVVNLPPGVSPSKIAAGDFHSLAVGSDGKLYAWGSNVFGELGNRTNTDSTTPVVVSLPAGVTPTAIAAGSLYSLVIGSDGRLYAWGNNDHGELGNSTTTNSMTPVVVNLSPGITPTAIAAGSFHSLALTTPPPTPVAGCQNFSQTGHQVCGRFLQYWQAKGGLAQQGLPISDVFEEKNAAPPAGDGKVHRVQYFERARFEEHLENQPPYDVLLGLLGSEQGQAKYQGQFPPQKILPAQPCQHFNETNLDVCGRFLEYWKANGGLAQQGLPISGVFEELNAPPPAGDGKLHLVQYFERARFEQHGENQPPYDVLLGLLGTEQYKAKYK